MIRYVVMKDRSFGQPVYIASDEADAARYLDELQSEAMTNGNYERRNSLTLTIKQGRDYHCTYEVVRCESWEQDPVVLETQEQLAS